MIYSCCHLARPSTPVYDLLGHKYQDRWLQERHKAEEAARARQEQKVLNAAERL